MNATAPPPRADVAATPEPPRRAWRPSRRAGTVLLVLLALLVGLVWGERQGWPWLVQPAANVVSGLIERRVEVSGQATARARLHLWGGVSLSAPSLKVGGPPWASGAPGDPSAPDAAGVDAPWLLSLEDGELAVGYAALLRMARGGKVEIERLQARRAQAWLIRLPDGRATWQLGGPPPDEAAAREAARPPWQQLTVHEMAMGQGLFNVDDQVMGLKARVSASVVPVGPADGGTDADADGEQRWQWAALAQGTHLGLPMRMRARSSKPWRWSAERDLVIEGSVGHARVSYNGPAPDEQGTVAGRFSLAGPSLAAVGEAVGVTLPTTAAFQMRGSLRWEGERTQVKVDQASIGNSRLSGDFVHERGTRPPTLVGNLRGSRLALVDLGPAVGVPVQDGQAQAATPERVLPDRPFNLPSLRAMDANVRVAIDVFDTGNAALQAMHDLRGRILLQGGVLKLEELSTRLAQGSVRGRLELDGRQPSQAVLVADLNVDDVRLEQWAKALQRPGREPLASGVLSGRIEVSGRGRSTAELLGTLGGRADLSMREGRVSHLGVELAGVDLMEGLVELLKGDDVLPIPCAQVRLEAREGVLHPAPVIITTPDSTIWADGQISLKDETLDLRTRVAPKDFSLVTLRTPLQLRGPWRDVDIKVMHPQTWLRILGAAALAAVHPLAGVLPLVDPGQREAAMAADRRCRQAMANVGHR